MTEITTEIMTDADATMDVLKQTAHVVHVVKQQLLTSLLSQNKKGYPIKWVPFFLRLKIVNNMIK